MKKIIAGLLFFFMLAGHTQADPVAISDDSPIAFTAQTLVYDAVKQTMTFETNVEVRRAHFFLECAVLTLYLKPAESASGSEPEALSPRDLDHIVA